MFYSVRLDMKVLVMGLGHLAQYIHQEFHESFEIWGTYRSQLAECFDPNRSFQFDTKDEVPHALNQDFDLIIWNYPPHDQYLDLLERADKFFSETIPWIYIGSTGVYKEGSISETSLLGKDSPRRKRLSDLEECLSHFNRKISIVRPSGLIDEKRYPGRFFKTKSEVSFAQNQINLVYTKDVARFIKFIFEKKLLGESFNLAAGHHPSKYEFYHELIDPMDRVRIQWQMEQSENKIIDNTKSKRIGFRYLIDEDLLEIKKLKDEL